MKQIINLEAIAKFHASRKSKILAIPCQNLLAGSSDGGEDILEKVGEPPSGLRTLWKCPVDISKEEQVSKANRAEAAKGRFYAAKSFAIASLSLIFCSQAFALPSNPHVMQGTLMVENVDAKTCVFTVGDETFLHCDDFSIAEDDLVEFRQPSSKSIVVVEVVTDRQSELLGILKSNGGVFIVNPQGIVIGENGSIDSFGFFASTLPACACPLIDGDMDVFVQGSSIAPITNKGRIKAWENDVYL